VSFAIIGIFLRHDSFSFIPHEFESKLLGETPRRCRLLRHQQRLSVGDCGCGRAEASGCSIRPVRPRSWDSYATSAKPTVAAQQRKAARRPSSPLTGCARGGGIGLEAMLADHNCEAAGYQLGTPEYANCRMALHQQSAINNAAAQAYYQRQQDYYMQQLNRGQTCIYNGSNIGGITGGTMSCR
jgi:hypothetical protein